MGKPLCSENGTAAIEGAELVAEITCFFTPDNQHAVQTWKLKVPQKPAFNKENKEG